MLVLAGIAVLVAGFLARLNPLLVVVVAALATGVLGAVAGGSGTSPAALGHALVATVATLGKAYNADRFVSLTWLILPLIGLLEREGLQQRARTLIASIRAATAGRLLIVYFLLRQATAAVGLAAIMGHAQTIRPLVAPMAEGALEATSDRPLPAAAVFRVRAFAAATDNVAAFFGEDIFFAFSSILLIVAAMAGLGVKVQPLQVSLWAIPSAGFALVVHGLRLLALDRRLKRDLAAAPETAS